MFGIDEKYDEHPTCRLSSTNTTFGRSKIIGKEGAKENCQN